MPVRLSEREGPMEKRRGSLRKMLLVFGVQETILSAIVTNLRHRLMDKEGVGIKVGGRQTVHGQGTVHIFLTNVPACPNDWIECVDPVLILVLVQILDRGQAADRAAAEAALDLLLAILVEDHEVDLVVIGVVRTGGLIMPAQKTISGPRFEKTPGPAHGFTINSGNRANIFSY